MNDIKNLIKNYNPIYKLFQKVSLKADTTKKTGLIRGITFRPNGYTYLVCWGYNAQETYHYEEELCT